MLLAAASSGRRRTASARAGEVRGPVATMTLSHSAGGRPAISSRTIVTSGCCDRRLVTSAGQPPACASRRARSMIPCRSSSVSWLNCAPRRTRSWFRATNRSTELFKNPTRLRPSNTNRRLTRADQGAR